jgi:isopenicillin-N N-acyltransferase-like protein
MKERIQKAWDFYRTLFLGNTRTESDLEKMAEVFIQNIEEFDGNYKLEIEGIAEGSGVDVWKIVCLNARTEIMLSSPKTNRGSSDGPNECTSIFCPTEGILAQNWDWDKTLEPLMFVQKIIRPDGHQLIQLTEPGILGKIGMNSAGVGVCLNILAAGLPGYHIGGVPVHILLRSVLDSISFDDALTRIGRASKGTMSHMFVASKCGGWKMCEIAGQKWEMIDSCIPLHTNHYLGCDALATMKTGSASSYHRFTRASDIIGGWENASPESSISRVKTLLLDGKDEKFPICRPYGPQLFDGVHNMDVGTLTSMVCGDEMFVHLQLRLPKFVYFYRFSI